MLGFGLGDRRARTRLGYLPELFRYPEWLCAREVLGVHARLCGANVRTRDVEEALSLVGLYARMDDRVQTFSKGMQQRLGLAVALLDRPDLIVLDEPTSALDPSGRLEVRAILHDLRERGAAVFLNSHLLTEVEQVCDRIAIVTGGRVVAQGTIPQILGPRHDVRVRAQADGVPLEPVLRAFGPIEPERGAIVVRGVPPEQVPAMVSALVRCGGAVHAVEPLTATLEERFLELTSERGA